MSGVAGAVAAAALSPAHVAAAAAAPVPSVASSVPAAFPAAAAAFPFPLSVGGASPTPVQETFARGHFGLQRVQPDVATLCDRFDEMMIRVKPHVKAGGIGGSVEQRDLLPVLRRMRVPGMGYEDLLPLADMESLALRSLAQLRGGSVVGLQVVSFKLLEVAFGAGEQMLHWDTYLGWLARGCYSFLLYLTDGVDSAALPKYDSSALDFTAAEYPLDPLPPGTLVTEERSRHRMRLAYPLLFSEDSYQRTPVHRGDGALFDCKTMHKGTLNTQQQTRRAVFIMILGTYTQQLAGTRRHPYSQPMRVNITAAASKVDRLLETVPIT